MRACRIAAVVLPCVVVLIVLIGCYYVGEDWGPYAYPAAPPPRVSPSPLPPSIPPLPPSPPPTPVAEQPEALTSGPVHEAFAGPVDLDVQEGLVVSEEPPPAIAEVPPAEGPEGDDFTWMPGYWGWDRNRNGYVWVSACWRAAPPNMSWMPGYWTRRPDGWEWTPGFWTSVEAQELEYLPAPPAPFEVASSAVRRPPSANVVWTPGCWYWRDGRYVWRPGYWLQARPDWVWVPSHYCWTPRGHVFIPGHWDYPLERRGVLFAPVFISRSVYLRPRFAYSPSIIIDLGALTVNLFAYPRYSHYYFGDYYDDVYLRAGIYPWFEFETVHTWYDPIYTHVRWQHRDEPRWQEFERRDYDRRRNDRNLRPPRTYREQEIRLSRLPESERRSRQLAQPMTVVVKQRTGPVRFGPVNTETRQRIVSETTEVNKFREERRRWESSPPVRREERVTPPAGPKTPVTPPTRPEERVTPPEKRAQPSEGRVTQPERVKIPEPPIVGKRKRGAAAVSLPAPPAEESE